MTESAIQKQIINYLKNRPDIFFFRNNVGRKKNMYFGYKGSGDLLGIMRPSGRFISIEVKQEKGECSEEQIQFMAMINSMGGIAFIAKSVDDVVEKLK
jgi:penicillin-binding protein-related factor A (putative recombinase)